MHMLGGDTNTAAKFPGNFDASVAQQQQFHGTANNHKFVSISNTGHDAASVLTSTKAVSAMFGK